MKDCVILTEILSLNTISEFEKIFGFGLGIQRRQNIAKVWIGATANPPKSDDKYAQKSV